MNSRISLVFTILFILILLAPSGSVIAQEDLPDLPVYVVQPGDTLNLIALKFNVNVEDLIAVNNISNANFLQVNSQLVIPGISGVRGILSYQPVELGQTPKTISRVTGLTLESLYRLNRTTSPSEFYLGSNIILTVPDTEQGYFDKVELSNSSTMIETAIRNQTNQWKIVTENNLEYVWNFLPGDTYFITHNGERAESPQAELSLKGLPLTQGKTAVLEIDTVNKVEASIGNQEISFFQLDGKQVAIFGIHAMQDPGLYPFHIQYEKLNGNLRTIDQLVLVQLGFYPQDPPLQVDPSTLSEEITKSEDELVESVTSTFSSEKHWDGAFAYPVDEPVCIKSWFGNRRSYNDQPYNRFHSGVDFGVCANLNIYAPAAGKVVFSGPLDIRGNATIIDHGLGVFSGYWHQETILVEVGQLVETRDLIGTIGNTGRSTGPHLHFEIIVNGTQVDPLDWLEETYP